MNAQSLLNEASKEQNRRDELFNLFYPMTELQIADKNITKCLRSFYGN